MVLVIFTFGLFAKEKKHDSPLEKYQEVIVENTDYSNFPVIDVYVNLPEKNNIDLKKEDFFIIENEKNCEIKNIQTMELPIEIVLGFRYYWKHV